MKQLDLNAVDSPWKIPNLLRAAAQQAREDGSELDSAWQDLGAGAVWRKVANHLEACADSIEKEIGT